MMSRQFPKFLERQNRLWYRHDSSSRRLPVRVTLRASHGAAFAANKSLSRCYNSQATLRRLKINRKSRWISTATSQTTTTQSAAAKTLATSATPPLPVRVALVATTTALGTPAFPVVGVLNIGLRYVVWDATTRYAILGATTLLGGVGVLVKIAALDLLPVVYSYGQLFLPFAFVNGGLASVAYIALDVAFGTARVASMPWAGAAMGAFVGFMGPAGLYDKAFQWCYDIPEADGWITYLLNNAVMLPICITTGAAVGFTMHPLLYFPIVGIRGVHWARFSAPLLAGTTACMAHLYGADYYDSDLFPPNTYLSTEENRELLLVCRFHARRLQEEDWGPTLGYKPVKTGTKARESVKRKLEAAKVGTRRTDMVFDSKRKAWLHYVTNGAYGSDTALETIPSEQEMNQQGLHYLVSDGAVAFILLQDSHHHNKARDDVTTSVREGLRQIIENGSNAASRRYKRDGVGTHHQVDRIEVASNGIALLLADKARSGSTNDTVSPERERELKRLEQNIRRLVPGLILYAKEEGEKTKECSVESQLNEFGWEGVKDEELKRRISREWASGLKGFLTVEQTEATQRQVTWAMTGLSMVLLYGLFGGTQ